MESEKASGIFVPSPYPNKWSRRVCRELDTVPDTNVPMKCFFFLITINEGAALPINHASSKHRNPKCSVFWKKEVISACKSTSCLFRTHLSAFLKWCFSQWKRKVLCESLFVLGAMVKASKPWLHSEPPGEGKGKKCLFWGPMHRDLG